MIEPTEPTSERK